MKRVFAFLGIGAVLLSFAFSLSAGWVDGYYKSDGTYVSGYYRSEPNEYKTDNKYYTPSVYESDNYNKSYYQNLYGKEYGKRYYDALKRADSDAKPVQVDGYYKSNGTYVEPYGRNKPRKDKDDESLFGKSIFDDDE